MATRNLHLYFTSQNTKKKNPQTGGQELVKATGKVMADDASAMSA